MAETDASAGQKPPGKSHGKSLQSDSAPSDRHDDGSGSPADSPEDTVLLTGEELELAIDDRDDVIADDGIEVDLGPDLPFEAPSHEFAMAPRPSDDDQAASQPLPAVAEPQVAAQESSAASPASLDSHQVMASTDGPSPLRSGEPSADGSLEGADAPTQQAADVPTQGAAQVPTQQATDAAPQHTAEAAAQPTAEAAPQETVEPSSAATETPQEAAEAPQQAAESPTHQVAEVPAIELAAAPPDGPSGEPAEPGPTEGETNVDGQPSGTDAFAHLSPAPEGDVPEAPVPDAFALLADAPAAESATSNHDLASSADQPAEAHTADSASSAAGAAAAPVLAPLVSEATGDAETATTNERNPVPASFASHAASSHGDVGADANAERTLGAAPSSEQTVERKSDSGRVAESVFDGWGGNQQRNDGAPADAAPFALRARDSSDELTGTRLLPENDDCTVITSPPIHDRAADAPLGASVSAAVTREDVPLAPDATQPGAELEVLEAQAVAQSQAGAASPSATSAGATLASWVERGRPRRHTTIEVVRKLVARRVDVSGLQMGLIVVAAGLAGGLVSRATASATRASARTAEMAPAAPSPAPMGPIVTPLPSPPPEPAVNSAPKQKSVRQAPAAPRKKNLASVSTDGKTTTKK